MENNDEQQEAVESQVDTETQSDVELPDYDTLAERVKQLEKDNKTLYAKKQHSDEKLRKIAGSLKNDESKPEPKEASNTKMERLELKVDGYSDEEADFILELGGKQALKNPIVLKAVAQMREENKLAKATDIKSSGGSSREKVYTDSDLREMSPDEMEKKILAGKIKVE